MKVRCAKTLTSFVNPAVIDLYSGFTLQFQDVHAIQMYNDISERGIYLLVVDN